MEIIYDTVKLKKLMDDFSDIARLSISIVDTNFQTIIATHSREYEPTFCEMLRHIPEGQRRCDFSDHTLLSKCTKSRGFESHICHAGLTDAVLPIMQDDIIIGYVVLGRMRTFEHFADIQERVNDFIEIDDSLVQNYFEIPFFDEQKVKNTASIAAIIVSYIVMENMIRPQYNKTGLEIKAYIDENLSTNLSIPALCEKYHITKNHLYALVRLTTGCTVNQYIIHKRMECAKKLLTQTTLPVCDIAEKAGIDNYPYFFRLFKKETGFSPLQYRKNHAAKA